MGEGFSLPHLQKVDFTVKNLIRLKSGAWSPRDWECVIVLCVCSIISHTYFCVA